MLFRSVEWGVMVFQCGQCRAHTRLVRRGAAVEQSKPLDPGLRRDDDFGVATLKKVIAFRVRATIERSSILNSVIPAQAGIQWLWLFDCCPAPYQARVRSALTALKNHHPPFNRKIVRFR